MLVFPIQPSTSNSLKPKSVWVECGGDPGFLANCFEHEKSPSVLRRSSKRENNKEEDDEEEETTALSLVSTDTKPKEESDSLETDTPRFTLQELRDVLQEKNQLKAQVFILQEELAYCKSEEFEDDVSSIECPPSPPPWSTSTDQVESGIRRFIVSYRCYQRDITSERKLDWTV
ncbi:RILP-like protein 1 isoform X2 [Notothenia coriiceps]|uniref:RILP-like protein 1 isoform X2 n=1 Tax=Notothenia coriiceps TaxID=8208 RepID=A0A6I9PRX9_9TELE|nr:PREDICTED: RILP-like protein 1 isoform X2 [Notothenia coriiceps]